MAIDSTSSLRLVNGSFTFEVTNPLLDGMGIGKFVSSSTFSFGGRDWRIDFYPDGKDTGAYVSAYLKLVRGTTGVSVTATFSLSCRDRSYLGAQTFTKTFESVGDDCGIPEFIQKFKLQQLLRLNGGRLIIKSTLMIEDEVLHTEDAGAAVVGTQTKLQQDLTDMLKSGEGTDVTFSVGGQLFPAHRCILAARSMVFKAELFGAMMEKDAQGIEIKDMEPAVFEALLHFIYTDLLPDIDADNSVAMQQLLVAADRYGLDGLRLLCEANLCRHIDVQTVATILAFAEHYHCAQLKGACIGFIASRDLGAIMETDGFKHLVTSFPAIMKEILDKVASVLSNK